MFEFLLLLAALALSCGHSIMLMALVLMAAVFTLLLPRLANREMEDAFKLLRHYFPKKPRDDPDRFWHIAVHEGGHVAGHYHFNGGKRVTGAKLHFWDDGEPGGVTHIDPIADSTREAYLLELALDYAGLMAEEVILEKASAGGGEDLKDVVYDAWFVIKRFGISDHPPLDFDRLFEYGLGTPQIRELCSKEVLRLCENGQQRARTMVAEEKAFIVAFAKDLMVHKHLSAKQIDALYQEHGAKKRA